MSTNVLILGAAGQIAGFAINLFLESKRVARPRMLIEQFGAKCRCAGARANRSGC